MNILGIGAHFDDIELGCSGTLIKHQQKGDKVTMLVVTNSSYANPGGKVIRNSDIAFEEGKAAATIIGAELICLNYDTFMVPFDDSLVSQILQYIEKLNIDTVYSHWTYDIHRDHQNTAKSALMAGKHVPRFLMYRSNFHDTDQPFRGTYYSDISDVISIKDQAIKTHKSEMERVQYAWSSTFEMHHALEGRKIGVNYAESFELVRYLT